MKNKRLLKIMFGLILLLLVLIFSIYWGWFRDNLAFESMSKQIFQTELSSNTINLHYTLAYPENFGLAEYEPILPCYSYEESQASALLETTYLEQLASLKKSRLSKENLYTYELLTKYLEHSLKGNSFPYYSEPLSPASGMQSELPILLAEYTFRSKQDVTDYLALLDQTDEYFASLAVYEAEKKDAGLLMSDSALNRVREQCYEILSIDELNNGTHFLQTSFEERTNKLVTENILTKEEAVAYSMENDRLLSTVMVPAYEDLADNLFLLTQDGISESVGLGVTDTGKAYYEWLVQYITGTTHSLPELKALLFPQFDEEYEALRALLIEDTDILDSLSELMKEAHFPLLQADDMLVDLQNRMDTDYPEYPEAFTPKLTLKKVSASLENYCAPAFYLTPPLDDVSSHTIYINERTSPSGLELYTTLAHEGYPGHLYQSVYEQLSLREKNPVRQVLWYGGYLEGWALYVELNSYDYAIALAKENGKEQEAKAYQIEKHNRSMQLCLYSLLDVSIHYDNVPYEKVHELLTQFGINDPKVTRAIYNYVAEEPSTYLKYYVGYLEILSLKDSAKELWKDNYSDYLFHQFLLEKGPADFDTLYEELPFFCSSLKN